MGLLNGVKDKLGFGSRPEWADDGYSDDYGEYSDYGEGASEFADGYDPNGAGDTFGSGNVVSFDDYNPDNFENVTLSSDKPPRVASYADARSTRSSRSSRSYGRNIGTSESRRFGRFRRSASEEPASWAAPEDPAFLDNAAPAPVRDAADIASGDPYSSLGSDFIGMGDDPATHLKVVRPSAYADVEKIANAAKAGKSVVLAVSDTKPALAKRILDFTFGVASALNLNVDKAQDRVFVVSAGSDMLSEAEREYLQKQGILK